MKPLKSLFIFAFAVFSLNSCFYGSPLPMMASSTASYTTEYGLHIVEFKTPYGNVYVNLPDDMAKGDVISGKLTARPAGKKEKERAKNTNRLNDHLVDIADQKTAVGGKWGKWIIPEAKELAIILMNQQGKTVAKTEVPVLPGKPAFASGDFQCPKYAQAGQTIQIKGDFNGDFSNTHVHLGGEELGKWAESPRQLIIGSPMDQIGETIVTLNEGDYKTECKCRNISVEPKAGKYKLLKGETTDVTVIVRGLEKLEDAVPLRIENKTPTMVKLAGEGSIVIQPDDVGPGGIYTYKTHVTGISPGRFHIRASIAPPLPPLEPKEDFD